MLPTLLTYWLWLDKILLKLSELHFPKEVRIRKLGATSIYLVI